jgi:hypothetical protein
MLTNCYKNGKSLFFLKEWKGIQTVYINVLPHEGVLPRSLPWEPQ